jgi:hypothetical protein
MTFRQRIKGFRSKCRKMTFRTLEIKGENLLRKFNNLIHTDSAKNSRKREYLVLINLTIFFQPCGSWWCCTFCHICLVSSLTTVFQLNTQTYRLVCKICCISFWFHFLSLYVSFNVFYASVQFCKLYIFTVMFMHS